MARVRDIEIDEVPAVVQPIYRQFAEDYGPFLNQAKVFAHRPVILKHLMGMLLELADESVLPKRYLEIALVTVSKLGECTYCVAHHAPRMIDLGLPKETTIRILEPDCPGLNEVDRLVRDYARQVTTEPRRVTDALYQALRGHFSEEQVVELTFRIVLCGAFNRFNDALQIEIEPGALEAMLAKGLSEEDLPGHADADRAAE